MKLIYFLDMNLGFNDLEAVNALVLNQRELIFMMLLRG